MDRAGLSGPTNEDFNCRCYGQKGHRAAKCPQKTPQENLVYFLWEEGPFRRNLPVKGAANGYSPVEVAAARVESGEELKWKKKEDDEPMPIVRESQNRYLVAAYKGTDESQTLPKIKGCNLVDIDAIFNKAPIVRPPLFVPTPGKKK